MNNISNKINNLIEKYNITPYEINNGLCEEFAIKIIKNNKKSEECCTGFVLENPYMKYPIHSWIYYKNKHYDAEAPNGVNDFQNLPFFQLVEIDNKDIYNNKFTK